MCYEECIRADSKGKDCFGLRNLRGSQRAVGHELRSQRQEVIYDKISGGQD